MNPSQHVTITTGPHAGKCGQIMRLLKLSGRARVHVDHPGTCDCEFVTVSLKQLV